MPSLTLKIEIGKIGVSPLPRPFSVATNKYLETNLPEGDVSVPKLIEVNGT